MQGLPTSGLAQRLARPRGELRLRVYSPLKSHGKSGECTASGPRAFSSLRLSFLTGTIGDTCHALPADYQSPF